MGDQHIPQTFLWAGASSGVKRSGRPDLGLVYSPYPATVSGVFTSNAFPAAPVRDAVNRLEENDSFRGLIVNSGVANAATGEDGIIRNRQMMQEAAEGLGLDGEQMLASSTGIIGEPLPLKKIKQGIPKAVDRLGEDPDPFARAIMTTDTKIKRTSRDLLDGKGSILGVAKGSGMIRPDMATMLAYLFIDLPVEQSVLDQGLSRASRESFNRITVDGDMSTNDTVLAWSAQLPNRPMVQSDTPEADEIFRAIREICTDLAHMIVSDGEGADKTIEIEVNGAPDSEVARRVADSIATSPLVKTAFHGEDPNWGRIFCCIGATGENLDPERLLIKINDIAVFDGKPLSVDQPKLDQSMTSQLQNVTVDLGMGEARESSLTCDLSGEYVRINAGYHA